MFSFYGIKNIHSLRSYLIRTQFCGNFILRFWREIIFAGFYSRDLNRQRLNKGIKCRDLRVLNFIIFFKMTLKVILQFYFLGGM